MQLVKPSIEFKQTYFEALGECLPDEGQTQLKRPKEGQSFEEFVTELNGQAEGKFLPEGYVPASTFWLIDNNELIGRVQIRHTLTEYLARHGGHIGYYIRPSRRRMGHGKKILELALVEAKKLSLDKVLITCNIQNTPSRKIIEANGGIFENIAPVENNQKLRRYWINLAE